MKTREKILEAIADHWAEHGYAPTYEDIAAAAGLATRSTVLYHLQFLRAQGKVDYNDGQSRTVRLVVDRNCEAVRPLFGGRCPDHDSLDPEKAEA